MVPSVTLDGAPGQVPARRSAHAQGVGFVQLGEGIVVHGF